MLGTNVDDPFCAASLAPAMAKVMWMVNERATSPSVTELRPMQWYGNDGSRMGPW